MNQYVYKPSAFQGMLLFILAIVAIAYLVLYRNWMDILLYSYLSAVPAGYRLARREGQMYLEDARSLRARIAVSVKLLMPTFLIAMVMLPFGGVLYGIIAALFDLFSWVATFLSERGRSTTFAVIATGLTGLTLFSFRMKFRCMYGLTEAIVGLFVAGHRMSVEKSGSADLALLLALLTAGVYLVVRGLDNIHQGWASRSDPLANWLMKRK